MKRARYQCSQETQQKLIDAVIQLAREKRYESITVKDICRDAGVSTGSFYHQFGSKDALVLAASLKIDWLLTEQLTSSLEQLPPLNALDQLLRQYVLYIRDEIGPLLAEYYRVLLLHPDARRKDADRLYCQEVQRLLTLAAAQGLVRSCWNPEELASQIMRLLRGLFMNWLIAGCSYDLLDRYQTEYLLFLDLFTCPPKEQ